ncbi:class I SAM-dependent methyltransferase [Amycolatopsis albispora]|uniref:Methyltransferase n=1 Tax=Amycolatopsis albispora TaxID=1804986 RepID=A0A344L3C8_9PSEU|nr:class I SAM-dependent methyltransferase [Amycolatopsis albispora]AXB42552.1 methyltransferase [Amycolatopsis albispora]
MTEPSYLTDTRHGYNAIATGYAERFEGVHEIPLVRAMLGAFAELTRDNGPVLDVGSGPGWVTWYLDSLGVKVSGVDLSTSMLQLARETYPGLRFEEGSMTALDQPDHSLAGLVAWYSIIHIGAEDLPAVFAEFRRVLMPGGHLALAFQVGDDTVHHSEGFGHQISLDFRRLRPERIATQLEEAGFAVEAQLVRAPNAQEKVPQAYLLASTSQAADA